MWGLRYPVLYFNCGFGVFGAALTPVYFLVFFRGLIFIRAGTSKAHCSVHKHTNRSLREYGGNILPRKWRRCMQNVWPIFVQGIVLNFKLVVSLRARRKRRCNPSGLFLLRAFTGRFRTSDIHISNVFVRVFINTLLLLSYYLYCSCFFYRQIVF